MPGSTAAAATGPKLSTFSIDITRTTRKFHVSFLALTRCLLAFSWVTEVSLLLLLRVAFADFPGWIKHTKYTHAHTLFGPAWEPKPELSALFWSTIKLQWILHLINTSVAIQIIYGWKLHNKHTQPVHINYILAENYHSDSLSLDISNLGSEASSYRGGAEQVSEKVFSACELKSETRQHAALTRTDHQTFFFVQKCKMRKGEKNVFLLQHFNNIIYKANDERRTISCKRLLKCAYVAGCGDFWRNEFLSSRFFLLLFLLSSLYVVRNRDMLRKIARWWEWNFLSSLDEDGYGWGSWWFDKMSRIHVWLKIQNFM